MFIFAIMFLGGYVFGQLTDSIGLSKMLGIMIWGILLSVFFKHHIPGFLYDITPFIKNMALIVILLRAGMGIDFSTLRKISSMSIRLAIIPAFFEVLVLMLIFHRFNNFHWTISLMAAVIITAISPAIVVPKMIELKDKAYGNKHDVPATIMAGSSLEVLIITSMFTLIFDIVKGKDSSAMEFILAVPWSFLIGVIPGVLAGFLLIKLFKYLPDSIKTVEKTLIVLTMTMLLYQLGVLIYSAWIMGVMTMSVLIHEKNPVFTKQIAGQLDKIWILCQIMLFVLIGIEINISEVLELGMTPVYVIGLGLVARSIGVLVASKRSVFTRKEKLFAIIAYTPKATVQAALGSLPLQFGIEGGHIILTYTVVAILVTSPLGNLGINIASTRLLEK